MDRKIFGLTKEEAEVISNLVDDPERSKRFEKWSDKNESELMKWYDEEENMNLGLFEVTCRFAYYCVKRFIEECEEG